jgi:serine protease AprX
VRSVWFNDQLHYFDKEARTLTGVERLKKDRLFITRSNGGMPVSGAGDFSVVINDSGIDATHPDLQFGKNVIQNVFVATGTDTLSGFTTLQVLENQPNTDLNVGHGTHCAGIVGGTGQQSGGKYAGVAPGAKLIGTGSGAVLFVLNALGGFEWSLTNQSLYGIRVISNSYGGSGAFDPDDPVAIAAKVAHDSNIIVVFAAATPAPAATRTTLTARRRGSSRSRRARRRAGSPLLLARHPEGRAPRRRRPEQRLRRADHHRAGHGPRVRVERDEVQRRLRLDPLEVERLRQRPDRRHGASRQHAALLHADFRHLDGDAAHRGHGRADARRRPDAHARRGEADSVDTASRMPGREEWEVGAGYVNAYAAVDKVFNRSKNYGGNFSHTFNARVHRQRPRARAGAHRLQPRGSARPEPSAPRRTRTSFNVAEHERARRVRHLRHGD